MNLIQHMHESSSKQKESQGKNADLKTEIGNIKMFNVTAKADQSIDLEKRIKVEMTDDEVLDEMRKMGKSSIKKAIKANQVKKKAKEGQQRDEFMDIVRGEEEQPQFMNIETENSEIIASQMANSKA